MAHELDFNSVGEARMVSLNVNPWHSLGKVVKTEMTDADILKNAGLDWTVEERPVYDCEPELTELLSDGSVRTTPGSQTKVEGHKLLRRSEDKRNFSIVSDGYRVFQNKELVDLMREISFKTNLVWETAGCLHKGQTVWALARLPDLKISVKGDETLPYMLLSNGHGNKRPLTIMPTAIRVVCANTLSMAQGVRANQNVRVGNVGRKTVTAASLGYSIKHTGGLDAALADVVDTYKHIIDDVRATQEAYDRLVQIRVTPTMLSEYWNSIFGEKPMESQVTLLQKHGDRDAELRRLYTGPTCVAGNGTLYAAYQAATEFVDHGKLAHKRMASQTEAGLAYAAKGAGWDLKTDAFDKAMALAYA